MSNFFLTISMILFSCSLPTLYSPIVLNTWKYMMEKYYFFLSVIKLSSVLTKYYQYLPSSSLKSISECITEKSHCYIKRGYYLHFLCRPLGVCGSAFSCRLSARISCMVRITSSCCQQLISILDKLYY